MALPLVGVAVASGASYVAGAWDSWFGDGEDGTGDGTTTTGASVAKVALYGLALYGAYTVYKNMKKGSR